MLFLYLNNMILVFIHRLLHPLNTATVPDARIFVCLTVDTPGNQSHHVPPKYSQALPRLLIIGVFFTLTANREHISFIGLLPVCSLMIGYMLDIQLFLLPQYPTNLRLIHTNSVTCIWYCLEIYGDEEVKFHYLCTNFAFVT